MALGLAALPMQAGADDVVHWQCRGDYDITTEVWTCCGDAISAFLTASPYPDGLMENTGAGSWDPREPSVWVTSRSPEEDGSYPLLRWETKGGKGRLTRIEAKGAKARIIAEGCRPAQGKFQGQADTSGGIAP